MLIQSTARAVGLVAVLTLLPLACLANQLIGRVVGVHDGDTLTLLDGSNRQHRIRLAGIDAPERGQSFGNASKENLSRLAFRRDAVVVWDKKDRFGRIVGKVVVGGTDVCLEQLRDGMAWHFKKYESEQPAEDRRVYADAEQWAKAQRNGLWRDSAPVPPWDWRRDAR